MTDEKAVAKLKGLIPTIIELYGKSVYSDEDFDHEETMNSFLEVLQNLDLPISVYETLRTINNYRQLARHHQDDWDYLEMLTEKAARFDNPIE